jgi:hypothetical protein
MIGVGLLNRFETSVNLTAFYRELLLTRMLEHLSRLLLGVRQTRFPRFEPFRF